DGSGVSVGVARVAGSTSTPAHTGTIDAALANGVRNGATLPVVSGPVVDVVVAAPHGVTPAATVSDGAINRTAPPPVVLSAATTSTVVILPGTDAESTSNPVPALRPASSGTGTGNRVAPDDREGDPALDAAHALLWERVSDAWFADRLRADDPSGDDAPVGD